MGSAGDGGQTNRLLAKTAIGAVIVAALVSVFEQLVDAL